MGCIGIPPYRPANRLFLYGIARYFAVGPRLFSGPVALTPVDREDALQLYFLLQESLSTVHDMALSDDISHHQAQRHRERADSGSFLVHFALSVPEFKDVKSSWELFFAEICRYLGALKDRIDDIPSSIENFSGAPEFFNRLNVWIREEALRQAREGL